MDQQIIIPVIIMATTAAIALLVAAQAFPWRREKKGFYFILLMVAVAIFAFTNAAEHAASSISAKITWSKLSYLGIISIAPLWFLFTESYSQRFQHMTRRGAAALWALPVITLILVWTNGSHKLIWPTVFAIKTGSSYRLVYDYGIAFWAHTFYAYILLIAGAYFLIQVAGRTLHPFRWQVIAILAASIMPWVANLLYLFDMNPWPGLDLTPIGFLLSGLIISWALGRFQILDLVPIARDVLFERIGDGVIVLDRHNRIIDINTTAQDWLGIRKKVFGKHISTIFLSDEVMTKFEDVIETQTRLEIGEGDSRSVFDLTISPLYNSRGLVKGRIISLHDITREWLMLQSERLRSQQMEQLNAITRISLSMPNLDQMLEELTDRLSDLFSANGTYLTLWDEDTQQVIPVAAYGTWREKYPSFTLEPDEQTVTEAALMAGHALVIEDVFNSPYISSRIAALFPTRSILALPLHVDNHKLGAVLIAFNQTHQFTPQEIQLGEQVSQQIALAMLKIRLYETEKLRAAQLNALHTISQVVVSSLDLEHIFETVVRVLQDTFDYQYVSIYHLDGQSLRLGTQVGSVEDHVYDEISIEQGVSGRAIKTREAQFVPDVSADPEYIRINNDIGSEICVPLIKDQIVYGILNVEASNRNPLAESDVAILTTFANQVAVAIENARLFKAERKQRDLAEAMRKVGIALSESLDFEIVLERMLDEIQAVVPYHRAFIFLLNKKRSHARVARQRIKEKFRKETGSLTTPLEYDLTQMANLRNMIESGEPLVIPDTKTNPIGRKTSSLTPVRSWVGAPIVFQNQVIGFLSLDSLTTCFYHQDHADRLALFASQAAVSIENARLFTETQKRARKEHLLYQATRDFTAGLGEQAVFNAMVKHLTHALDLANCAISRYDPAFDILETLEDYSEPGVYPPNYPRIPINLSAYHLTRAVIKSREPFSMHIENSSIDPDTLAFLERNGYDSLLLLPLMIGHAQQVFGIVALCGKAGTLPFTNDEIELAQSLITQAARAIENSRLYAEVQRLAVKDELTGLYNRRGFLSIGQREWDRSIRLGSPLTLLFLDIDEFKKFNDRYSYAVGDQVLRLLADCLKDNMRTIDFAGRYGGEEFVVLLPETGLNSARQVAERLRNNIKNIRLDTGLDQASFTVSIGVCQKTTDLPDLDALIDLGGNALRQAKKEGRNRVIIAQASRSGQREGIHVNVIK
jgi:diguanylate cyclase (GGDEF)-like protein